MIHGPRRAILSANPPDQAGFRAWYRELYTASSGAVSEWTDKSGNGLHATQVGARRPVVSNTVGIINGHEAYRFTRGSDELVSSWMTMVAKSSLISASAFSIYILAKSATGATASNNNLYSNNTLLGDVGGGGFNGTFQAASYASTAPGFGNVGIGWSPASNPTFTASTNGSFPYDAWRRMCFSYDGTLSYARMAGGTSTGTSSPNVGSLASILKVGGWNNGPGTSAPSAFFDGWIAEMIFYNQYHPNAVQDMIFGYQRLYFGI